MTTEDTPTDAPQPTPGNVSTPGRRLTRSRDQRVIAGVCGGLGRYCGVDPLLFRIGLVVLVFFGGVGAVIYVAAWLFLPADGDAVSPAEALLGRGQSSTSTLTTVVLAVLGVIALSLAAHGEYAVLLALAVVGIVLLARRGPTGWT
ncbi:MAG: PspC domain-containing protein, partial [Mycobacteriales bacterium]